MRTFIIRVMWFAITVFVVFLGIEKAMEFIGDDEYQYKHDYLNSHLEDIKLIALGHSHIADGINMIELDDSGFNTAIPSRHMFYDAEIIKEFVPKMPKLRTVILPLGYNFQYRCFKGIDNTQKCLMAKYWGYHFPGDSPLIGFESLYGSKGKIFRLFFPAKLRASYYDSLGHQHIKRDKDRYVKKTGLPLQRPRHADNTEFVSQIKEIARVCKSYGVRLITLTMPCFRSYVAHTTKEGISELHALVDSMREVYPEVEYYDFMWDSRFEEEDFYDLSHLNEVGALKFTSILKNEVLPYHR